MMGGSGFVAEVADVTFGTWDIEDDGFEEKISDVEDAVRNVCDIRDSGSVMQDKGESNQLMEGS